MNESWPSKSCGLGSLSLSGKEHAFFFFPCWFRSRLLSLLLSLSASSLVFLSRSTNSLLPEVATAIPSNSSLRPALKLTEVMNDGFS